MRRSRLVIIVGLALLLSAPALAQRPPDPRQLGPFKLGMTLKQFRSAAVKAGFQKPKRQIPQERDLMGLGLIGVRPVTTESSELEPKPGRIWQVTAYVLSGRVAYLAIDYGLEDPKRAQRWFDDFGAPINVRKSLIDTSWAQGGVVLHVDRFGQSLHAVDWAGLNRSNRILVNLQGAVKVANKFFRELHFRQAEASLDVMRRQTIEHFRRPRADGRGFACKPPPSVDLSPAEDACVLPEKRFPLRHKKWADKTWALLGVNGRTVSRHYSFRLTSSGEGTSSRITLLATGDLDCDGKVSTIRVKLRADPTRGPEACTLDRGQWEVIDPLE